MIQSNFLLKKFRASTWYLISVMKMWARFLKNKFWNIIIQSIISYEWNFKDVKNYLLS